ncbi:MAG: hypothetical protein E7481_04000 [Ruminococcaceae bacterium]|nr:hypothetical protein [Oscillospiraceae bacterium]
MKKIIIMSDVHLCRHQWGGVSAEERMEKMVRELNESYDREKYEAILFLGDYSLDFWLYDEGGTYVHKKVSNTERLIKDYLSKLKCQNYHMIPGNHEQYGNEKWLELTGKIRQFSVVVGGYLFVMLDTFADGLDPDHDHDGVYTGADIDFVKTEMEKYPEMKTVLCAHYFAVEKTSGMRENADIYMDSSDKLKKFLREEDRIVCLFFGHDHTCATEMIEDCGKYLFHDGQYSYSLAEPEEDCPRGWREVWFDENSLKTAYFSAEKSYREMTEIKF